MEEDAGKPPLLALIILFIGAAFITVGVCFLTYGLYSLVRTGLWPHYPFSTMLTEIGMPVPQDGQGPLGWLMAQSACVVLLTIGTLIAGRMLSPKLSVVGGALSAGLFFTTLSFMFSTPGVIEPSLGFPAISVAPGQFLLKDLGLLAVSIFVAGHSLVELEKRKINA